jgi:hypothetical protein
VIATFPSANEGLTCDTNLDECGVSQQTVIQLRLDRFIDPATAVRQSVLVFTGGLENNEFAQPEYDVVERVLLLRPLATLRPRVTYTVEILIPSDDEPDGLRAFDGAPLEAGPVPLRFDFRTNAFGRVVPMLPPEPAPSCAELVEDLFSSTAGCGSSSCHVRTDATTSGDCPPGYGKDAEQRCVQVPRMGLELATREGLLTTAIGKVAHQTELGAKVGAPLENPARFGVQMPIIDPARPDNSNLLYKLLRNPGNYDVDATSIAIDDPCATRYPQLGPADHCAAPSDAELTRIREWFVRGDPMPAGLDRHISRESVRKVQAWIRGGAACP